jgi:hypothetical protein
MRMFHPQAYPGETLPGAEAYPGSGSIADGLVFSFVGRGGPTSVYSRVDGFKGSFTGSGTPPVWTPRGINFTGTGAATSYVDFGANNQPQTSLLAVSGLSVVARLLLRTSTGGVIERNDGNTVGGGFEIGFSATVTGIVFEATSVNGAAHVTDLPPLNKFFTFACTSSGFNDFINNTHFYFDGVEKVGGKAFDAFTGTSPTDLTQSFRLGRLSIVKGGLTSSCLDGEIQWLHVWRRVLSQAEVQLLQTQPFAMYRERSLAFGPVTAAPPSGFAALTLAP